MKVRLPCGLALILATTACATSDGLVNHDTAATDPWCERQYRAAREQPVSPDAQEARALRGLHVSGRCARAWREAHEVPVRLGRDRIPPPVPSPRRP